MTANKTEVTSKELADAMEKRRSAKEVWLSAKQYTEIACSNETDALNEYNRAKKEFEDLMDRVVGEK